MSVTREEVSSVSNHEYISESELREATAHRKLCAIIVSVIFTLSTIFLVLVNVGTLSTSPGLPNLYMFKFDVSNVIPASVPNAQIINSLARTIGLHDFYQVGMWNFCQGYNSEGVTSCSKHELLYWFNPVEILTRELLAGATIALPAEITMYLKIIRIASQIMFGCFFASTLASFVLIFLAPLTVHTKLWTIPIALFALATATSALIGAGISTGMWSIFARVIRQHAIDIHIVPDVGGGMLAVQWIAAGSSFLGAAMLLGMMCCGTSRRDIRTGRRVTRKSWKRMIVPKSRTKEVESKNWFGLKKKSVKA